MGGREAGATSQLTPWHPSCSIPSLGAVIQPQSMHVSPHPPCLHLGVQLLTPRHARSRTHHGHFGPVLRVVGAGCDEFVTLGGSNRHRGVGKGKVPPPQSPNIGTCESITLQTPTLFGGASPQAASVPPQHLLSLHPPGDSLRPYPRNCVPCFPHFLRISSGLKHLKKIHLGTSCIAQLVPNVVPRLPVPLQGHPRSPSTARGWLGQG